jgi:hypothetical protein
MNQNNQIIHSTVNLLAISLMQGSYRVIMDGKTTGYGSSKRETRNAFEISLEIPK